MSHAKRFKPDTGDQQHRQGHRRQQRYNNNHNHTNKSHHQHGGGRGEDDQVPQSYLDMIKSIGSSPADIERWKEERRRRFPRSSNSTAVSNTINAPPTVASSSGGFSLLGAAYDSDDEEEAFDATKQAVDVMKDIPETQLPRSTAELGTKDTFGAAKEEAEPGEPADNKPKPETSKTAGAGKRGVCGYFSRNGHCRYGDKCKNEHIGQGEAGESGHAQSLPKASQNKVSASNKASSSKLRSQKELFESLIAGEMEKEAQVLLDCLMFIASKNFFETA